MAIASLLLVMILAPLQAVGQDAPKATAGLNPIEGFEATGRVELTQSGGFLYITGELSGVGAHSIHSIDIFETGDCSNVAALTGESISLGKVGADARGIAALRFETRELELEGPRSVIGRILIAREWPDAVNQPDGASGAIVACGVVERQ